MAVGTFNPDPPFAILDQGGVGNWWYLPYMLWEVREPGRAVGRYVGGDNRTHTVEIRGEGFAFGVHRLGGPTGDGPLLSGTVTTYRESWEGVPLWTFTGFSLTAAEIHRFGAPHDVYYGLEHHVLRGADTITGTNGDNSISGREGHDELHGLAGGDRLWGDQGADRLFGEAGNDSLDGAIGDDTLNGGAGDDSLTGGPGRDTAETSALRRQVTVTEGAGGATMAGPEGTDALSGVEVLRFADGALHLDAAGSAGQVWRLYGAALGRNPEATGLGAWTSALDAGAITLADAAERFIASAEFAQRHGRLDDAGFVSRLYANVLGRDPDAAGLENWTAQLARGASRAEVLLGFSESAEYRAGTDAATDRLWAVDPEAVEVARCYLAVLDRLPDASGLAAWTSQRNAARLTNAEMTDAFIASTEFQARFGALSNAEFVERLYVHSLDRPADAAGRGAWTSWLDSGAIGRRDVVQGFAYSDEMTQKLLPLVSDGIAFA